MTAVRSTQYRIYSTYTVVEVIKYGIFDDISIWILNLEVEQIGALWLSGVQTENM